MTPPPCPVCAQAIGSCGVSCPIAEMRGTIAKQAKEFRLLHRENLDLIAQTVRLNNELERVRADNEHLRNEKRIIWEMVNATTEAVQQLGGQTS